MSNKPPTELITDFHELTGQLVDLHGGQWTYNDGTTVWEKDRTDGYNAQPCGDEGAQEFHLSIIGPPVDSPEDAVAKVKEHFLNQGFTVTNRFSGTVKNGRVLVFSMRAEDGASFVYQPGTHASGIVVDSECSMHPDMDKTTK